MISMIQLKQVLRNRRFVLFTILLPLAWYMFLYNIQANMLPNIMLGIAVFIGIIGNSLATFSKRISSDIGFYSFESRFSNYGIKNFLLDQTFVQIVLNTLIFVVVLGVATVFAKFPINGKLGIQFFLLTVMGIYFSIIGFVLGVRLDAKLIDTVGFPVIILAALTIIPFASFGAESGFISLVAKVQRIFPGYYYTNMMNAILSGNGIQLKDMLLFITSFVLNIIPLYFLVPKVKLSKAK